MRSSLIFLVSILAVVFSSTVDAQCKGSVMGTWKLVWNQVDASAVRPSRLCGVAPRPEAGQCFGLILEGGNKV
jgi:hypothetical protein